jgi:hypothetical protein
MAVAIDQSGQDGIAGEIDDACTRWQATGGRRDGCDPPLPNDDDLVLPNLTPFHVHQTPGPDRYALLTERGSERHKHGRQHRSRYGQSDHGVTR